MSQPVASKKPRAGRWGDREASILDAAWALISGNGYDKTTMADVAAEVGLSEGTLYNYVPSKQALAIRVAERWFSAQADALAEALTTVTSTQDKIALILHRHLAMILDEQALYLMWIREVRATDAYLTSTSRDIFRAYTSLLKNVLMDARAEGELSTSLTDDQVRDMIYGGVEHIAWTAIVQKRAETLDVAQTARALARTHWQALAAQPEAGTELQQQLDRIEKKLDRL